MFDVTDGFQEACIIIRKEDLKSFSTFAIAKLWTQIAKLVKEPNSKKCLI